MAYFPFFIDIQDKSCIVVGGGTVAYRKVKTLLSFGVYITVISPVFSSELEELKLTQSKLILLKKSFERSDLTNAFFVVAATNNRKVNHAISSMCMQSNVLVNIADSKEESSFLFPSIVKRDDIVIGTSTSGTSPDIAKWVRKRVENAIPEYVSSLAKTLGEYRDTMKERIVSNKARKEAFKEILYIGMKKEGKLDEKAVWDVIKKYEGNTEDCN